MRTPRGRARRRSPARPLALAVAPLVVLALVLAGQSASGIEPTTVPSPTPSATAAPEASPTPEPTVVATPAPAPRSTPAPPLAPAAETAAPAAAAPAPAAEVVPAGLGALSAVLAPIPGPGEDATYLRPGEDLVGALPFRTFRLTVLVGNPSDATLSWTPRLEFRRQGDADFAVVPEASTPGVPLHTTHEWVRVPAGTEPAPATATLDDARLEVPTGLTPVAGFRASGPNPAPARLLPARSAAEQEFTVALSLDAEFGATYEVRVSDGATPLAGPSGGRVVLAGDPGIALSPGQQAGVAPVPDPFVQSRGAAEFALVAPAAVLDTAASVIVGPGGPTSVHQPFGSTTSGECATCHSTHRGQSQGLLAAPSQTAQCATCHGAAGLGGPVDVAAQLASATPNDPATRSYFSHEPTATGHVLASDDEFGGRLNRHTQCADCHNPHNLTAAPATYSAATSTWALPGGYGTSGVAVVNGPAGTSPTYEFLNGGVRPITAEYQLCLKCHSGFTTQLPNDPARPSRDRTDLGKAFNPNNLSYHPVEAPGRNQTTRMADSLAGTSPYKLWNLSTTDTVRCVMCHTADSTPSGTPADSSLQVHASAQRGILVRRYESRVLSSAGAFYEADGFALCLTCHAETPFMNPSGAGARTATNFTFHGLHTAGIPGKGRGGTDIDTPGAGQGNARCAECHFRNHAPTDTVPGQDLAGTGLVSFSPNVTASRAMGGAVTFTRTATGGSCTLTCHGKDHQGARYAGAEGG